MHACKMQISVPPGERSVQCKYKCVQDAWHPFITDRNAYTYVLAF